MTHCSGRPSALVPGALAVVFVAAIGGAACTLIGAGVGGAARTPDRSRMKPIQPWQLVKARHGAWLELRLQDGSIAAGSFAGFEERDSAEYSRAYATARSQLPGETAVPPLRANVLRRTNGDVRKGKAGRPCNLRGFDYSHLWCDEPQPFELLDVAELADDAGHALSGADLQSLLVAGRLPVRQVLQLEVADESSRKRLAGLSGAKASGKAVTIPLEAIAQLEISRMRGHALTGMLVGALIDGAIVLIATQSSPPPSSGGGSESCPFVYSYDGRDYQLDAEPFGGSFAEAAQRTAWSPLDHLREAEGVYRLRVTDELDEIEHLDEVKLLVVDHAAGASVATDIFGAVHSALDPVSPLSARGERGEDALDLVASRDHGEWSGIPFGRDPAREADLHDGLVLEFPRQAGASATLFLRARSTPWFPALFHRVLELPGTGREAWYARIAADPAGVASLISFAGEAFPVVKLWNGATWTRAGLLWELPTVAWGTQAFRLDLSRSPGDVVRIRLEGLPGTWALDHAVLGFGPEPALDVAELSALEARVKDGRDVRAEILVRDGVRLDLRKGDVLEIAFEAPPPRPGSARSFVLRTAGHYTVLFPPGGAADMARFEAIFREPGALARFAVEHARETLHAALAGEMRPMKLD